MQNLIKIYNEVQELWAFSLKISVLSKMMLGKVSSPFCIPVNGESCFNISIYAKFDPNIGGGGEVQEI